MLIESGFNRYRSGVIVLFARSKVLYYLSLIRVVWTQPRLIFDRNFKKNRRGVHQRPDLLVNTISRSQTWLDVRLESDDKNHLTWIIHSQQCSPGFERSIPLILKFIMFGRVTLEYETVLNTWSIKGSSAPCTMWCSQNWLIALQWSIGKLVIAAACIGWSSRRAELTSGERWISIWQGS